MIKFASVWLLVMDMSILAYFFRPNDVGFGFGAFFVLLTIVLSLIFKSEEDKEDVFSIIYHKIRPIQPIFFILLLIAHAHKFSYGAAYERGGEKNLSCSQLLISSGLSIRLI